MELRSSLDNGELSSLEQNYRESIGVPNEDGLCEEDIIEKRIINEAQSIIVTKTDFSENKNYSLEKTFYLDDDNNEYPIYIYIVTDRDSEFYKNGTFK